jgi:acetyl esterase/lipase
MQTPEHVADLKAVIAWLRANTKAPVWLVGTSRGTQSAAYAATRLAGPDAPDGIVLSATILSDPKGRAVPAMTLDAIRIRAPDGSMDARQLAAPKRQGVRPC